MKTLWWDEVELTVVIKHFRYQLTDCKMHVMLYPQWDKQSTGYHHMIKEWLAQLQFKRILIITGEYSWVKLKFVTSKASFSVLLLSYILMCSSRVDCVGDSIGEEKAWPVVAIGNVAIVFLIEGILSQSSWSESDSSLLPRGRAIRPPAGNTIGEHRLLECSCLPCLCDMQILMLLGQRCKTTAVICFSDRKMANQRLFR